MHPQSTTSRLQFVRICECGCGQPTLLARETHHQWGWVKGQPLRFLRNHHFRGERNVNWNNRRYTSPAGYVYLYRPDHHFAPTTGYVAEHRLVIEEQMQCCLLPNAHVHHRNGVKADNRPENLEVLHNSEHRQLHNSQLSWSRQHQCCIVCGQTNRRHKSHGRCVRCHQRHLAMTRNVSAL